MAAAFCFDVEGTLVDSVRLQLACWREVLMAAGCDVQIGTLQEYSGMDGNAMLAAIVPKIDKMARRKLLDRQSAVFETRYLSQVQPFDDVRRAIQRLKEAGHEVALATDCKGASLEHYRAILGIDDLLDAIACGEDVDEGKPNPKLLKCAIERLHALHRTCVMVGDSPYDAQAAMACGVSSVGIMTGGFGRTTLQNAGCSEVLDTVSALPDWQSECASRSLLHG